MAGRMTSIFFAKWHAKWQRYNDDADQRLGQACYNAAIEVFGENEVSKVCGTVFDPFHDDDNIPLFLAWLGANEMI